MNVPLVADRGARFPEAYATETAEYGWVVVLDGVAESVLPRGAHPSADGYHQKGDQLPIVPKRLPTSVHDAYQSLEEVGGHDDAALSAEALARHCQEHPVEWLLCKHGLPVRHLKGPRSSGCDLPMVGTVPCLVLNHVTSMMEKLVALESLAYLVVKRRQPLAAERVEDALWWEILPELLGRLVKQEMVRDGQLGVHRCRQVVMTSLSVLQEQSWIQYSHEWFPNHRFQLVAHTYSDLGFYIMNLATRIENATDLTGIDASVRCVHCDQAYRPRIHPSPGAGYCSNGECQKARKRDDQARRRQRIKAERGSA